MCITDFFVCVLLTFSYVYLQKDEPLTRLCAPPKYIKFKKKEIYKERREQKRQFVQKNDVDNFF